MAIPPFGSPPGAPKNAQYVTLATNTQLTVERVLTGTANQVILTDNGAGSTIVLSLPQSIATASSPTFTGLTLSGNETIAGYLRVGSNSAPTNVTAGDVTAVRLSLGNSAAFSGSTGEFVQITGTMTDLSGTNAYMFVNASTVPASNSTASFQGINFVITHAPGAGVTQTGITGGNFAIAINTTGTVTTAQGFLGNAIQVSTSSAATASVTTAQAVVALPGARLSGTTTTTVTTMVGFDMNLGVVGNSAWTITSLYGSRISDLLGTTNTITTFIGNRVESLTKGLNNIAAQFAYPGLENGKGASTDAVAVQVPVASVALSNQTAATTNVGGIFIGIATYTSTTLTRTATNLASLYIAGAPVASTNVTATNGPYSIWVDAGTSRFDGQLDLSAIAAGSTNLTITATSDTPTVTWGAVTETIKVSVAPTGYLEISVGGNARYIPFWT